MCQGAAEPAKETLAGQRGKEDEKSGKGEKSRREGRRLSSALDSKNTGVKPQPCPHRDASTTQVPCGSTRLSS